MADQLVLIGKQVGDYRLERLIGRGSTTEVYEGRHIQSQRQMAVKIWHTQLGEVEQQTFLRELQMISKMSHTHLLDILQYDVQYNVPVTYMELLPNGALRQRLKEGQCVPLSLVVTYVKQLGQALQYLHDNRLTHLNVKPENLLLDGQNNVVLADIWIPAIAHHFASSTRQFGLNNIPYMAPELFQNQSSPASDQYALAIVIYEWLSGWAPFQGKPAALVEQHRLMAPPPLREKVENISEEVERVIQTALAKDPQQRFADITAFANALEAASYQKASTPKTNVTAPVRPVTVPGQKPTPSQSHSSPSHSSPGYASPSHSSQSYPSQSHSSPSHSSQSYPSQSHSSPSHSSPSYPSQSHSSPSHSSQSYPSQSHSSPSHSSPSQPEMQQARINQTVMPVSPLCMLKEPITSLDWSPDGKYIVTVGSGRVVSIWDAATKKAVQTYQRHRGKIQRVAWGPQQMRHTIASASSEGNIQIWNANSGMQLASWLEDAPIQNIAWSPDGQFLVSINIAGDNIKIWDAKTSKLVAHYRSKIQHLQVLDWSADGTYIVAGNTEGSMQMWFVGIAMKDDREAFQREQTRVYQRTAVNAIKALAWAPNKGILAYGGSSNNIDIWNPITGISPVHYDQHKDQIQSIAWSPDGSAIASASSDTSVHVWDPNKGTAICMYRGHSETVNTVKWSPNGQWIASGSNDHTIHVWSPNN